jgi:hypothetical protein
MEKLIKKDVQNVASDILEILQKDIAEIKVALLGNEYNPTAGLLYRMTQAEKCIEKLEMRYQRILWTVVGGASVISILFNLVMAFFDKFALHTTP